MAVKSERTRAALMALTRTLAAIDVENYLREKAEEGEHGTKKRRGRTPRRHRKGGPVDTSAQPSEKTPKRRP